MRKTGAVDFRSKMRSSAFSTLNLNCLLETQAERQLDVRIWTSGDWSELEIEIWESSS